MIKFEYACAEHELELYTAGVVGELCRPPTVLGWSAIFLHLVVYQAQFKGI